MAMMAFDSYLDGLLTRTLHTKHNLPEGLVNRIVMSPKFGRDELLSYWLKYLFAKSFTEDCPLNERLKKFGDLRNDIVHPSERGFEEGTLTYGMAEECVDVAIKSIKWINDLKLGKL